MIQYVSRMTDKKKRTLIMGFEYDQKNTIEKGMAVLMECKEIQQKYIPFIDDKLSKRELDAFCIIWKNVRIARKNMTFIIQ